MSTDTARLYTAEEVAAARAAGEESAREAWSKFHDIAVAGLELKHRRELRAVQESLGIEQHRNRIDADVVASAVANGFRLNQIATTVTDDDDRRDWFGRRARRQVAEVRRLLFGADE